VGLGLPRDRDYRLFWLGDSVLEALVVIFLVRTVRVGPGLGAGILFTGPMRERRDLPAAAEPAAYTPVVERG
jgi:hypothetical protein